MISSYGFGTSSRENNISGSNYQPTRRWYQKRHNNRYDKNLYNSEAAQMLYENEHYKNTVDRYRYLKERRQIDLERRRRGLGQPRQ